MTGSDIALRIAIPALWIVWCVAWFAAAPFAKPTRWREAIGSRLLDRALVLACVLLFVAPHLVPRPLSARFVPAGEALPLLGALMVAAGLGFAAWARRHIGRNWSGRVEVKEGHALVRSGPYRFVRHPIYTGLLLAIVGTALALGEWRGALAVVLVLGVLARRIGAEEQRMRQTFPEYEEYRRATPALIPRPFRSGRNPPGTA